MVSALSLRDACEVAMKPLGRKKNAVFCYANTPAGAESYCLFVNHDIILGCID